MTAEARAEYLSSAEVAAALGCSPRHAATLMAEMNPRGPATARPRLVGSFCAATRLLLLSWRGSL